MREREAEKEREGDRQTNDQIWPYIPVMILIFPHNNNSFLTNLDSSVIFFPRMGSLAIEKMYPHYMYHMVSVALFRIGSLIKSLVLANQLVKDYFS